LLDSLLQEIKNVVYSSIDFSINSSGARL